MFNKGLVSGFGVVLLIFLCHGNTVRASDRSEVQSLEGLREILVFFGVHDPAHALSSELILKPTIELKLREAGVRINAFESEEEKNRVMQTGELSFGVQILKMQDLPLCAVIVRATLRQDVSIPRNGKRILGTTWDHHFIGIAGTEKLDEQIRTEIRDLVDQFLNDYLAANPKVP